MTTNGSGLTDAEILEQMSSPPPPPPPPTVEADEPPFTLADGTVNIANLQDHIPHEADRERLGEWVAQILRPLLTDITPPRITQDDTWCTQWTQHPLVSLHVHAAYLAWPTPELGDDAAMTAQKAVYWRNAYLAPIIDLVTGSNSAFSRCKDGHRAHNYPAQGT